MRTTHGRTDEFPIKVCLHQGSGLSPFLFIVVLDVISEEFRCGLPSKLLFANEHIQRRRCRGDGMDGKLIWRARE